MHEQSITIRQTEQADLANTMALWNDGDVMKFVGFPEGLGYTIRQMERWLKWIEDGRPKRNHYSIYEESLGYCGETFYSIDREHGFAGSMDIKLFQKARGRGIAYAALSYAIGQAFQNDARCVWVDPNPKNEKALRLYEKLGFQKKEMPGYLAMDPEHSDFDAVYMEITLENWKRSNQTEHMRF